MDYINSKIHKISEDKTQKQRIIGIDYLKVLSILMVIMVHVHVFQYDFVQSGKVFNLIQYALRLLSEGVPLFLIINGYLLFKKDSADYKKIYKKAFSYYVLYLIFGSLTIVVINYENALTFNSFMIELLTISPGKPYTGSLWFIQSLIAAYFIFPVLHYIYKNEKHLFNMVFKIVALFSLGLNSIKIVTEVFLRIDADKFSSLFYISEMFERFDPFNISSFLLFFLLGAVVNQNIEAIQKNIKKLWIITLIMWLISLLYAYITSYMTIQLLQPDFFYGSIFSVLFTITMFVTFLNIREKGSLLEKVVERISSNTLWIYLVHNIVIFIFLQHLKFNTLLNRVIFFVIVVLVSSIFSVFINIVNNKLNKKVSK